MAPYYETVLPQSAIGLAEREISTKRQSWIGFRKMIRNIYIKCKNTKLHWHSYVDLSIFYDGLKHVMLY